MDPSSPSSPPGPSSDPLGSFEPTGGTTPSGPKVVVGAVVGVVIVLALALVGLFAVVGSDDGEGASAGEEATATTAAPPAAEPDGGFSGEPSDREEGDPPPPAALDLLADPEPLVEVLTDAVGPGAAVVELGVFPTLGTMTVRDEDRENRVANYTWVNRELSPPEADTPRLGNDLERDTFPLRSVAFDRLPLLVRRAPERAGFPGGSVIQVLIDSVFTDEPRMRIYVTSDDEVETTYLLATLDGRFTSR